MLNEVIVAEYEGIYLAKIQVFLGCDPVSAGK
jgi:hypothetical protein